MKKVLNIILSILKIILLFVSFVLTFYIVMAMYQRLEKDILKSLDIFIPYVVLLLMLLLNHVLKQKYVTSNTFYNITCCLVFSLFVFIDYRTMYDNNMLLSLKNTYNMSFYYFSDMVVCFKALLYMLIGSNFCLIIAGSLAKKEKVLVDDVKPVKNKISTKGNNSKKTKKKNVVGNK